MYADEIPVIDIDRLDSTATQGALDVACREWGFFQGFIFTLKKR